MLDDPKPLPAGAGNKRPTEPIRRVYVVANPNEETAGATPCRSTILPPSSHPFLSINTYKLSRPGVHLTTEYTRSEEYSFNRLRPGQRPR